MNHAGQHGADDHVNQRADGEPAEDTNGQIPLRIARLLGRRRDRVEADVGKKHDRRALMNAGKAVRRKRRVVGRVDMHRAHRDEEAPSTASLITTMMLFARALSRTPRRSSHVMNITIANAGRFTRIGTPAIRGAVSSSPWTPPARR